MTALKRYVRLPPFASLSLFLSSPSSLIVLLLLCLFLFSSPSPSYAPFFVTHSHPSSSSSQPSSSLLLFLSVLYNATSALLSIFCLLILVLSSVSLLSSFAFSHLFHSHERVEVGGNSFTYLFFLFCFHDSSLLIPSHISLSLKNSFAHGISSMWRENFSLSHFAAPFFILHCSSLSFFFYNFSLPSPPPLLSLLPRIPHSHFPLTPFCFPFSLFCLMPCRQKIREEIREKREER